jgi:ribosomal protein L40E
MKRGPISSRRCRRCGQVATAPLPTSPQLVGAKNSPQIPLCAKCSDWSNSNPSKVIQ